jgi:hypothetical protein
MLHVSQEFVCLYPMNIRTEISSVVRNCMQDKVYSTNVMCTNVIILTLTCQPFYLGLEVLNLSLLQVWQVFSNQQ